MTMRGEPARRLSPEEVERVARATRAALRALLVRLQAKLTEIEGRPEPWPAKWTALKLSARRVLEEHEASYRPVNVIAVETARALLAEMARLEQQVEQAVERDSALAVTSGERAAGGWSSVTAYARWRAVERWLATRAVLYEGR
jgi:hypothetical protein